jgi:hypothetical protein
LSPENSRDGLSAANARAEADFEALRVWALQHLDALPESDDDDANPILTSLRMILVGDLGCTEENDYTPAQWFVLLRCKEAARVAA